MSSSIIVDILEALPNVKRVWLSGFSPKDSNHTPPELPGRFNLDRLSLLYIRIVSFDTPKAILGLLSLFGRVGELHVDEIQEDRTLLFALMDMKRWDRFPSPPQLAVRRLTMVTPWVPTTEILIALQKTPSIGFLEEIDIHCGGVDAVIALGTLIQNCTRMRRLRFDLSGLMASLFDTEIGMLIVVGYSCISLR